MTADDVTHVHPVVDRVRAADHRVDVVARWLLAHRLGLFGDDVELLAPATVTDLLALPSSVVTYLGAARLLGHLDAVVARAHPVTLDRPTEGVTVATVVTDEEDELTAALDVPLTGEPVVELRLNTERVAYLTVDDVEALAYALLRLVQLAREEES